MATYRLRVSLASAAVAQEPGGTSGCCPSAADGERQPVTVALDERFTSTEQIANMHGIEIAHDTPDKKEALARFLEPHISHLAYASSDTAELRCRHASRKVQKQKNPNNRGFGGGRASFWRVCRYR
ncbi:hypothetical protein [Accumulibacter sp.]|nr:hypothetical protein [Accumulibacter sp.]HRF04855.1 hypothetical protein [Accumulibacter sp.]